MIRPLCKQFKQSAMPGPVKRHCPSAGRLCNPCLRASRRPHGRGKTVTVAKGWGLVTNNAFGRINAAIICDGRMKLDRSTTVIAASESK